MTGSLGPRQESPSSGASTPGCHGPSPCPSPLAVEKVQRQVGLLLLGSQMRTEPSAEQEARRWEAGLKARPHTASPWPSRTWLNTLGSGSAGGGKRAASGPRPSSSSDSPAAPALPSHPPPPVLMPSELLRLQLWAGCSAKVSGFQCPQSGSSRGRDDLAPKLFPQARDSACHKALHGMYLL